MRILGVVAVATMALAVSGCATKGYVNRSVSDLEARQGQRFDQQGQRLDQIDKTSKDALDRATAAGKLAQGKFLYNVVLSDDAVKFRSGKSALSQDAQDKLTALTNQLKSDNKNVYLEIQGHTDSAGTEAYNKSLGLQRAEAVRLFLYKQGIALNRMSTISYGESAPVASNRTADGRAANRRVVIVVLN